MQFELDDTLIDAILFSMQDQNDDFVIDAQETAVISVSEIDENEDAKRYVKLPEWNSSDGFRLMERFAVSLKNPPVKRALKQALDQGKGVFRAFKNVLNENLEAEHLWHVFKDQEMRKHIIRWYNALREEWGLERVGEEPEETNDLILEDFIIRHPIENDINEVKKLRQSCEEEYRKNLPGDYVPEHQSAWNFPHDISWVAENRNGDFAAYLFAKAEASYVRIIALEVVPEYRGMGIGEALLNHCIAHINKDKTAHVLIDVPVSSESFSKVLFREGFAPYETRFFLEMKQSKEQIEISG